MINRHTPVGAHRRFTMLVLAAVATLAVGLTTAVPAAGAEAKAAVGYVRLAHLSPDTPDVDVYLSKVGDATFAPETFKGVGYGVVSQYLAVPVGTYAVAMRLKGADPATKPVLSTQVTVTEGNAYTVAGVGKNADLGLKVLNDDLTAPTGDQAKVRVIQASISAPVLNVSTAAGVTIANAVPFATTTSYNTVPPGTWTLKVTPTGSTAPTTLAVQLAPGAVYSLLVLDSSHGLTAQLRVDAAGPGQVPSGAIETGDGGTKFATSAGISPLLIIGGGLAVLIALFAIALRTRRLASRRA